MKFDLSFAGFVLSLIVAASGWFFRWNDKQKFERQQATQKAVAAAEKALNEERDFNHLRNNQVQISQGIATGFDEIERRLDHLRELLTEIKAYLIRNQRSTHEE
ncbi:MAG: hypothetical protein V7K35_13315 [Nostoc sp.]|uniref:hypothetical protein n=1 Tax=Nostoc sp. TaxID=1180 RepID=UPI002FF640DF